MDLDFMLLTNYAEVGGNGLLYISGGGWDTITARAPIPDAPPGVFAVVSGTLVIRLLFHATESNRDHQFSIVVMDEDGDQIGEVQGGFPLQRTPGLPATWHQPVNIPIPLTGLAVPHPGEYRISLQVNGQFVGEKPFRVLKGY